MLKRGDFLKPGKPVEPGVPAFLNPLPAGAPADPADIRPMAGRPRVADDGAVDRQPGLAGLFRHRDRRDQRGPRHAVRAAVASRAARLAGRRVHGPRLEPQASAPADRDLGDLPPVVAGDARAAGPRPVQPAAGPRAAVPGRAEIVRDIALAASGLLDPKIGGPSVFPPAPAFLFQPPASYGPKVWNEATGPDRYRRALYTFRYRSVPYPMLQTFDAPNGDFACVRRARSNTPLQALTHAQRADLPGMRAGPGACGRSARGASTDCDRLVYAFRRCLARDRRPSRRRRPCSICCTAQTQRFEQPGADPWDLAADDPSEAAQLARRRHARRSSPPGRPSRACC